MKKNLGHLRRLAKKFGAEVVINWDDREMFDIEVFAPKGYHWDEDPHSLVGHTCDTRYRHEIIEDVMSRMTGLEKCDPEFSNCIDSGCFA